MTEHNIVFPITGAIVVVLCTIGAIFAGPVARANRSVRSRMFPWSDGTERPSDTWTTRAALIGGIVIGVAFIVFGGSAHIEH